MIHMGPQRDVTVNTSNGVLTFDSRNWLIGKYLYVKQAHEESEIRSALELLTAEGLIERSGSTIVNVGANIGMTCIALVKSGHFDRAIAFEPDPGNYRLLVRNIDQNGLRERIQTFPVALSSTTGPLEFELSADNSGDHRVRHTDRSGFYREETRRTISVPGETLDNFFENRTEPVHAFWVDIQGHEGHFFLGARTFLERGIPVIFEFWPYGIERAGTSPREFVSFLSAMFTHFWVIGNRDYQRAPLSGMIGLFDAYSGPRSFCLVVLAAKRSDYGGRIGSR
jgi:FkbM family methyltransferase